MRAGQNHELICVHGRAIQIDSLPGFGGRQVCPPRLRSAGIVDFEVDVLEMHPAGRRSTAAWTPSAGRAA